MIRFAPSNSSGPDSQGVRAAERARFCAKLSLLLALSASAGCAPATPGTAQPKTAAEFLTRLHVLVAADNFKDARQYVRASDPIELAKASSDRGDVVYLALEGMSGGADAHPLGIDDPTRSLRTWVIPGTADQILDKSYNDAAYDFAKLYNQSLAKIERRGK